MITCPKCGAENKSEATVCRMCASSLTSAGGLPPTAIFENKQGANSSNPGETACPTCGTMNEADWAFCQQCGTKLKQAARPSAQSSAPSGMETVVAKAPSKPAPGPDEFKTVVAQPPVIEPQFQQGLKTVASEPPAPSPQAPSPQAPQSQRTVPERPPESEPRAASAQPAAASQPPAQQPQASAPSYNNAPADKGPSTEQVQSLHSAKVGTVACPQCSHPNNTGGLFCARCGASLTVAKTVVMSSYTAPPKGKLHLVMEGGQVGDTWELDNEIVIGRTAGEITFPHDGYMSGRHARIVRRGEGFVLVDEGSRNGTFIKINNEVELKPGDMILVGKQLFRFEV